MKKLMSLVLAVLTFVSTQSFANSIKISKLKKLTKETTTAKEGTSTCIGKM